MIEVLFTKRMLIRGGPGYLPGQRAALSDEHAQWAFANGCAVRMQRWPDVKTEQIVLPPSDKMIKSPVLKKGR